MGTFVYAPAVQILIQTRKHGLVDVSDDIVRGNVVRQVNTVSTASWTLRNPRRKYDGIFTPNDSVVIRLKRTTWLPVFVGYLNSVPLVSAYQKAVDLSASCTLKKLQYWLWDPGTTASVDLITTYGDASRFDPGDPNYVDGGMASLAHAILTEVVGWSSNRIHIGAIPPNWLDRARQALDVLQTSFTLPPEFTLTTSGSYGGVNGASYPITLDGHSFKTYIGSARAANSGGSNSAIVPFDSTERDWWLGRKIVVTNVRTNTSVVCQVTGAETERYVCTVSDDVAAALQVSGSTFDCRVGFAPDDAKLGPLVAKGTLRNAWLQSKSSDTWYFPLPAGTYNTAYHAPHHDGAYSKIDIGCPTGTPVLAMFAGTIMQIGTPSSDPNGGNSVVIQGDNGWVTYLCHFSSHSVKVGDHVSAGQEVGKSGSTGRSTGPHLHVQLADHPPAWTNIWDEAYGYNQLFEKLKALEEAGMVADGSQLGQTQDAGDMAAKMEKLVNNYDWSGAEVRDESQLLAGPRALLNDESVLPFIQRVISASQRHFCSGPNGDFCSWFPDYFGNYKVLGVLNVSEVELQDFSISWEDSFLITHQFVVGSWTQGQNGAGGPVDENAKYTTNGIASVDFPPLLQLLFNLGENDNLDGLADPGFILNQFGARVDVQESPMIMSQANDGMVEFWQALNLWSESWAKQFIARVPLTFMPEAWPGMLMRLPPALGFQAYISSVSHSFDFEGGGFSTDVAIVAPSTYNGGIYGLPRSGAVANQVAGGRD